ncbi:uncharacterized protein J3D65DRAFT_479355 [Phyllosticta citribraziliensis]|uniref:Uncharacterized protein n=1 Tax=Phyllosticta citribraziliensis TaxID=989973 RepID=A0ABR1LGD1_9PEZI
MATDGRLACSKRTRWIKSRALQTIGSHKSLARIRMFSGHVGMRRPGSDSSGRLEDSPRSPSAAREQQSPFLDRSEIVAILQSGESRRQIRRRKSWMMDVAEDQSGAVRAWQGAEGMTLVRRPATSAPTWLSGSQVYQRQNRWTASSRLAASSNRGCVAATTFAVLRDAQLQSCCAAIAPSTAACMQIARDRVLTCGETVDTESNEASQTQDYLRS